MKEQKKLTEGQIAAKRRRAGKKSASGGDRSPRPTLVLRKYRPRFGV